MTTGIDGLTPCPFCGAGVTRIDEHRHWTGMRYQVLSVEVRHWCAPSGALPRAYISCTGKTTEEAVEKWNTRVHKAAKSEEKPCPDCAASETPSSRRSSQRSAVQSSVRRPRKHGDHEGRDDPPEPAPDES